MKTAEEILFDIDESMMPEVTQYYDRKTVIKAMEAYKNQFPQEVSEFEREKIRQITIHECKEELLKHLFLMTHQNSYPAKAVPQATILELEGLMRSRLTGK